MTGSIKNGGSRAERVRQALRANLRRRKEKARALTGKGNANRPDEDAPDASTSDIGGHRDGEE